MATEERLAGRAVRLFFIAAFASLVAVAGVFALPPLDRDEARFAQATAQMLETGDFVTIRFQADERNKKPPGIHWLQALSVSAFSSVEAREIWAYRLPSVIGAVLAALFTYAAGARLYGPGPAMLAALLLAASPAVAGEATIAKTDAMLLAAVTAAQASFIHVFGAVVDGRRPGWRWPLLFWLSVGAGVLLKGPIILMVVGASAAAMVVHRPKSDWIAALRPISGLIVLVLMIGPWALAIDQATEGRFFAEAIGGDMLAKIGAAKEDHGGPPGYYAAFAFALFWPAAALILSGLRQAIATRKAWTTWFVIGWLAPSWIVFELTATKLPHYTLPIYPAIALLAARAAMDGSANRWAIIRKLGTVAYIGVGLALAGLVAALPVLYREDPLKPYCLILAATIGLAALAVGALYWRGRVSEATIGAVFLSASVAWTMLNGVLPNLDRLALSPRLSAAVDAAGRHPLRDNAGSAILAGYYEPSAIFLLGTETMLTDGAGAADRLTANRAAIVEKRQEAAFVARADAIGASVLRFSEIEGVNYSNGDDVDLSVWRLAPAVMNQR